MGHPAVNHLAVRRFWLTWRADIAAGILLVLFMIAAIAAPSLLIYGRP